MSKTKFSSFDDLLVITADSQKSTALCLREIILTLHPEACEVIRLGERTVTYGLGPEKMRGLHLCFAS
jgi:hypothetical protein